MGFKAEHTEVTLPSQNLEVGREDVSGSNLNILGNGGAKTDLPEEGTFYPRVEEAGVSTDHLWK